ncbi:mRNA surveillance protein pelota [Candidatus Woesearchaeota archaeon]|nr:mRNA surveillance protein pelota [Candidatus Woesearchaeota archaeon]
MQLLTSAPKQGALRLQITAPDDLWLLSQIISPGDALKARTERKIKLGEEKTTIVRRTITLEIQVEKVSFSPHALRISGKILEGAEDIPTGSYHTLSLEEGTEFSLTKKNWPTYQLKRLKDAATEKLPPTLIVAFDREEAYFAVLKRTGPELLTHLRGNVTRKRIPTKERESFWQQAIKAIKEYDTRLKLTHIILASPSFWKEELLKELKDKELRQKMILVSCASVDESALTEAVSSPDTQRALQASRTAAEIAAVDALLTEIRKNSGLAAYGTAAVQQAANAGSVKQLLITDTFIVSSQEKGTYADIDSVLGLVDKNSGAIIVVCADHAGGKKLNGLGGIAAILRYVPV